MNCPKCGAANRDESRFCLSCGSRVDPVADATVGGSAGFENAAPASSAPRRPALLAGAALGATAALVAVGLFVLTSGGDAEDTSPLVVPTDRGRDDSHQRVDAQSTEEPAAPPTAEVTPTAIAPTSPPPTTAVPTTAASTTVTPSAPKGFPFPNAFEVPQLGYEAVRGTGCGADASIGDVVPDGWWFGGVEDITSASLRLDLVCAYFGVEASARIAECATTDGYESCTLYWGEQFWPVNNTERYRVVPVDPALVRRVDSTMGCSLAEIDRYQADELSWVHIVGGRAVHLEHLCPGG